MTNSTHLDTNADFVSLNNFENQDENENEKKKIKEKKLKKKKKIKNSQSEIKIKLGSNLIKDHQSNPTIKNQKRKEIQIEGNSNEEDLNGFIEDCVPEVIKMDEQESKKKKRKKNKGRVEELNEDGMSKKLTTQLSGHVSPLTTNVIQNDTPQDSVTVKDGGKKKRKKVKSEVVVDDSTDQKILKDDVKVDPKEIKTHSTLSTQDQKKPSEVVRTESNEIQLDSKPVEQSDSPGSGKKPKKDKSNKKLNPEPKITNSIQSSNSSSSIDLQNFISMNKITYEPQEIFAEFPPILSFDEVQVNHSLSNAFLKFQKPTPIQSSVWPVLISKRDVVGIAETGSGKTLAFGIPAFDHLLSTPHSKSINVLVISPTRELAMQTESTLSDLGKLMNPPMRTLCVYGGVDKNSQRRALQVEGGVRAVAGTPGRLLDLANEGHLKLGEVSWLVLDEADRMLDKGFENDIRAIINLCLPSKSSTNSLTRLTAMFSATWPLSVRRLASDFMKDPVRILVGDDQLSASCSVEQTVEVLTDTRGKEFKLIERLKGLEKHGGLNLRKDKVIVFALYKKEAQRLHGFLIRKGFGACCIEGDMSQDKRSQSLEDFKSGRATILVATDVAARGLDIPKVEVVINVTFPLTIEDYIHRIGRTGRAGRTGKSITFFTDEDKVHAGELMRVLKDANQIVPEDLKKFGGQIKKKTVSLNDEESLIKK
ncbi:P-loop containing nucleoside triphosphate hydrolase protein [Melampsora americana]|nr:P-loop containing nucleoside triphosphate hydrolase protein [Melampsora americana]